MSPLSLKAKHVDMPITRQKTSGPIPSKTPKQAYSSLSRTRSTNADTLAKDATFLPSFNKGNNIKQRERKKKRRKVKERKKKKRCHYRTVSTTIGYLSFCCLFPPLTPLPHFLYFPNTFFLHPKLCILPNTIPIVFFF